MPRTPVMAGNWKMFKTAAETVNFLADFVQKVAEADGVEIVICPPFTAIEAAARQLNDEGPVMLGAQNLHWAGEGAFTGEISTKMLLEHNCRYVILGHSERRQHFHETDWYVNQKLMRVLKTSLTPIVCVGESLEERRADRVREVILSQLQQGLDGLTPQLLSRIIIAYEPIWAIGTGETATPETAQEVHYLIRSWLSELFSKDVSEKVRILYGGSVKPDNVKELMSERDIDGALVGGASLDADSFAKIVRYSER